MSDNKIRNRVTLAAALVIAGGAAAAAFALTGNGDRHVLTVNYPSGVEGKHNKDAALPGWVPDEARSVTEVVRTTGSERLLRFTSGVALPDTCGQGKASPTAATLSADWWPRGQERRTNQVCDENWHVFVDGDTVYAFRPETTDQSGIN
jgi:hypothetical protein